METDVEAIKNVLKQYELACNNGDLDHYLSLWKDDGCQMPHDGPTRVGKEQIAEAVTPGFDSMTMKLTISIEDARVSGDMGVTRCSFTFLTTPKSGGETMEVIPMGKALTVYERQADGTWLIAFDCYNESLTSGDK